MAPHGAAAAGATHATRPIRLLSRAAQDYYDKLIAARAEIGEEYSFEDCFRDYRWCVRARARVPVCPSARAALIHARA